MEKGWLGTYFLAPEEEIMSLQIYGETPEIAEIISGESSLVPTDVELKDSPTLEPTYTKKPTLYPTNIKKVSHQHLLNKSQAIL